MAAATTDTTPAHVAFHDLVGSAGGNALQLVGASLSITGAVSNGGLCEITVSSTATYSANEIVSVYNVGGATGCNGTWKITVTDGTHLTLQSTTFGGSYTSGGTVTNGSAFNVSGDVAVGCYFSTVIALSNIFFQTNTNDIASTDGCTMQIAAGNVFGGGSESALIFGSEQARILVYNDFGIASGTSASAIQGSTLSLFAAEGNVNINFLPGVNPTYPQFAVSNNQAQLAFQGITMNLNGNTVTGARCSVTIGGNIISNTGNANTYFPGSTPCTQSGGGNIDGVVIPPNPSASTLGGIESIVATAHQWISSIDTSGVPHQSQPATSDLSDVTAPTSWTAADSSGVSLSLTASDTLYAKIGKVCTVSFAITYPTTSDTSTAQVSGIPSVCAAKNGTLNYVAGGTGFGGSGSTGAVYVALQKNGQSLFFFTSGNPQTNANMSGTTVRGTITYITN